MMLFALSLLATLVFVMGLDALPSPVVALAVLFVIALLIWLSMRERYALRAGVRTTLGRAGSGVFAAILLLSLKFVTMLDMQLLESQVSVDLRVLISVVSVPERNDRRTRFEAVVLECLSCAGEFGPHKIMLSDYSNGRQYAADQTWELTVRLKPMSGLRNPGGFDRVRWSVAKGLNARGYIKNAPPPALINQPRALNVNSWRESLARSMTHLPSSNQWSGLVKALTLGIKHEVSERTWAVLRQTGTAHLLAISGLHITLLAGWALILGRTLARVCKYCDPRTTGIVCSLFAACLYALLAGFELPTQRAVIMLSVWAVASLRFRSLAPTTGIALALVAVLAFNPMNPLSAGFWLSFGTVAALFYLHKGHQRTYPHLSLIEQSRGLHWWRKAMLQIPPLFRLHVSLGLLLLPVTAWFFQSGSLIAPVANLIAVPWVGVVIVPLCFIVLITGIFSPMLADLAMQLAQYSIMLLLSTLEMLVALFGGAIVLVAPTLAGAVFAVVALLTLFSPRGLGLRWLALPLLLPVVMFNLYRQPISDFEVHVLDVGQGLAALVFTDNQTLLFDTGGKISSNLSMFEAVVVPFLHASGRHRIDTLVLSHGDEDHAFGAEDAIRRFPDIRVISSQGGPAQLNRQELDERCVAGMHWADGDTYFTMLHPSPTDRGSDNNRSCVLIVHNGASRVLFTGDIEAPAESRLVDRIAGLLAPTARNLQSLDAMPPEVALPVDLMIAPHHGSSTSSSTEFLAFFQPKSVVYPAGYANRYGFPHVEVQLRYKSIGSTSYTTGTQGAVSFVFDSIGLLQTPSSWWQSHRRFWHGIVNPVCSAQFADRSTVLRLLELARKGQTLCGK